MHSSGEMLSLISCRLSANTRYTIDNLTQFFLSLEPNRKKVEKSEPRNQNRFGNQPLVTSPLAINKIDFYDTVVVIRRVLGFFREWIAAATELTLRTSQEEARNSGTFVPRAWNIQLNSAHPRCTTKSNHQASQQCCRWYSTRHEYRSTVNCTFCIILFFMMHLTTQWRNMSLMVSVCSRAQ